MSISGQAETTPQLGLYSWDDGGDFYNHTQLSFNWYTIDNDLIRKAWVQAGDEATQVRFVAATVGTTVITARGNADTNERFNVTAGGSLNWGPGGSASTDLSLYRFGSGTLSTDGKFRVNSGTVQLTDSNTLLVGASGTISSNNVISLSSTSGTSLLFTNSPQTYPNLAVSSAGSVSWGAGTSNTYDVSIYRAGAGTLSVSGNLLVNGSKLGFFGSASAQSTGWSTGPSNVGAGTKTYDATSVSVSELAHTLGNVINALRTYGILGA
jgi:hypothetical protein